MHRWSIDKNKKNLPACRPSGGGFPCHTLVPDQALRDLHPGLHGDLKGGTPALGYRVDLALASLNDLRVGRHVASLFKFPEHRIDGALGRRTTAIRGAFHHARDFVAMHRPRLQHTQNEKLGEAHFDETIPIRTVGIIHGLSARYMSLPCCLCHAGNHIPRWAMCQGNVATVSTTKDIRGPEGYAGRNVRQERHCYTGNRPSRSTGYMLWCPWTRRQVPSLQTIARA